MPAINLDEVVKTASSFGDAAERCLYERYENGDINFDVFKELLRDIQQWEIHTQKLLTFINRSEIAQVNQL